MTREEAIKILNEFILFKKISNITEEEAVECFKLAAEALQQQPSEDEKIIRIKKGTLKARTGRYVIYDVEWLKEHFNTTEAKIYGQPSEDWNAVLDELNRIGRNAFKDDTDYDNLFNFISNLPNVKPQSKTDILDKIEAEIGQAFLDDKAMQEHTVKKCLGIIDKYKGERKG